MRFLGLYRQILAFAFAVGLGAAPLAAQDAPAQIAKIGTGIAQSDELTRVFFGRVVARQTVDLAFQVGGQILELPADEGATIPEGALIAQLDLEPFALSLEQAIANRDQAERTLERFRRLEGSAVSAVSVEDAETNRVLTDIAVRDAERALRLATLNAPFTAVVAARKVSNFTTIAAGTPVVRLHDMSDLRIEIDVPELLFQRAGTDPAVELFAEFPAAPGRYPLEFREFNAETTTVGQTYTITLGMAPQPGLAVLPGSSVTVYTKLLDGSARLEIPASAVVLGNDGAAHVMAFEPAGADTGTVTKTPVTVEPTAYGLVAVTEGLDPDQEIVLAGAALLQDGDRVRRFAGFGN